MLLCRAPGRSLSRVRSLDDRGGERGARGGTSGAASFLPTAQISLPRPPPAPPCSFIAFVRRHGGQARSLLAAGGPPPGAAGGRHARVDRAQNRPQGCTPRHATGPCSRVTQRVTVTTRPASGGFGGRQGRCRGYSSRPAEAEAAKRPARGSSWRGSAAFTPPSFGLLLAAPLVACLPASAGGCCWMLRYSVQQHLCSAYASAREKIAGDPSRTGGRTAVTALCSSFGRRRTTLFGNGKFGLLLQKNKWFLILVVCTVFL